MEPDPMQTPYTTQDARDDLRRLSAPSAFGGNPTIRTAIWSMASATIRGAKVVRLQDRPDAQPVTHVTFGAQPDADAA
jgi:hypothetical protein